MSDHHSLIAAYARIAAVSYPDYYASCLGVYPDDQARGVRAAAECAYILENDERPEWATVIANYEVVDGHYIFVHTPQYDLS